MTNGRGCATGDSGHVMATKQLPGMAREVDAVDGGCISP